MRVSEAYEILELERDADLETIKGAYRKRARETHPDKQGDHYQFIRVRAAYEIICEFLKSPVEGTDVPMPEDLRELVDELVRRFREQFESAQDTCTERFAEFRRELLGRARRASRGELKEFSEFFREKWNRLVRDLFQHFNEQCRDINTKYETWFDGSTKATFKEVNARRMRELVRRPGFYGYAAILLLIGVARSVGMDHERTVLGYLNHLWTALWPVALTPIVYWVHCACTWRRPQPEERLSIIPFKLDQDAEFEGSAALKESAAATRAVGLGGAVAGRAFGGGGLGDPLTGAVIGFAIGSIVDRLVNPTEKIRASILGQLEQFLDVAEPELTAYVTGSHIELMRELQEKVIRNYDDRIERVARLLAKA